MYKKRIKRILNISFYVIITMMTLFIAIELIFPNKTLEIFGFKTYVVLTGSMQPDIKIGDIIIVTKTDASKLEVGDAITFLVYLPAIDRIDNVTHYIADIQEVDDKIIYKTQGANKAPNQFDNWTTEDGTPIDITYDDIIGRVFFILPIFGYLVWAIRDPIFVGLILINILVVYLLIKYIKSLKKEGVSRDLE